MQRPVPCGSWRQQLQCRRAQKYQRRLPEVLSSIAGSSSNGPHMRSPVLTPYAYPSVPPKRLTDLSVATYARRKGTGYDRSLADANVRKLRGPILLRKAPVPSSTTPSTPIHSPGASGPGDVPAQFLPIDVEPRRARRKADVNPRPGGLRGEFFQIVKRLRHFSSPPAGFRTGWTAAPAGRCRTCRPDSPAGPPRSCPAERSTGRWRAGRGWWRRWGIAQ